MDLFCRISKVDAYKKQWTTYICKKFESVDESCVDYHMASSISHSQISIFIKPSMKLCLKLVFCGKLLTSLRNLKSLILRNFHNPIFVSCKVWKKFWIMDAKPNNRVLRNSCFLMKLSACRLLCRSEASTRRFATEQLYHRMLFIARGSKRQALATSGRQTHWVRTSVTLLRNWMLLADCNLSDKRWCTTAIFQGVKNQAKLSPDVVTQNRLDLNLQTSKANKVDRLLVWTLTHLANRQLPA